VFLSVLYITLQRVLQLLLLLCRSTQSKDLEIIVLRHSSQSCGARSGVPYFGRLTGCSCRRQVACCRASTGRLLSSPQRRSSVGTGC
jgi:hypothetical protein